MKVKRTLIVKDSRTKVELYDSHLQISSFQETQYIGLEQIKSIYINKNITMSLADAVKIASRMPFYFIDGRGKILGKILLRA